jgi:hypothetical protein
MRWLVPLLVAGTWLALLGPVPLAGATRAAVGVLLLVVKLELVVDTSPGTGWWLPTLTAASAVASALQDIGFNVEWSVVAAVHAGCLVASCACAARSRAWLPALVGPVGIATSLAWGWLK